MTKGRRASRPYYIPMSINKKTKKFVADPNKAPKTPTRRAGGRRSASASHQRDDRSRSPEQEQVDRQVDNSIPHSTLPDPANGGVTHRLPKKNTLDDFPRVNE
eukprot:978518-Amphidinium_carterae.1